MEVLEKSPSLAAVEERYKSTARSLEKQNIYGFPNCSKLKRRKTVYAFLETIVDSAGGCDNYDFIFFLTKLEEKYGSDLTPSLWEILNEYMLSSENVPPSPSRRSDVAFAALYNLIHHYYRANDHLNLAELCGKDTGYLGLFFNMKYYLTVELFQRYMGILGHADVQYRMCLLLNKYVETGVLPPSAALNAAFVNSVCELCNRKFREEERKHFYPEKGVKARLNDDLFLRAYSSSGKRYKFDLSVVADWKIALQTALKLVDESISFNRSYPKYHYLKAQVLFYTHLLSVGSGNDDGDEGEIYERVLGEATVAEVSENRNAADYLTRIDTYKNFEATVMEYRDRHSGQVADSPLKERLLKEYSGIFLAEKIPPASERPPFDKEVKDFVFICYSSRDFKPVYRDIIELLGENVGLWYDREAQPGESWKNTIREKIRTCKCVLCYISENALTSQPMINELRYAKQYNKQVIGINLTHGRIAQIVGETQTSTAYGDITTDAIKIFSEIFEDEITVISRNPRFDYTGHIPKLTACLNELYPSVIPRITSESLSAKNSIEGKPNEDFCIADEKLHIYAVADGISRKPAEYAGENALIAREVSETFCTQFVKKLKSNALKNKTATFSDGDEMSKQISEAFKAANAEAGKLIESRWNGEGEKPGCVAVVAAIAERTLYFGNVGDCVGILVRGGRQIIFAGKQTRYAFDIAGVENDRDKLAAEYVNHTENRYGYGVINGEEQAAKFLRVSHIALEPGDVVYLTSDGLSDYVEFAESGSYLSQSVEELERSSLADYAALRELENSVARDYDDDRTVIKITFR